MSQHTIVKDPVCGMDVDSTKAIYKTDYKKMTYYFCNPKCEVKFKNNPEQYLLKSNNKDQVTDARLTLERSIS